MTTTKTASVRLLTIALLAAGALAATALIATREPGFSAAAAAATTPRATPGAPTVAASGVATARINLMDGENLTSGGVNATTGAAADFDEDGVADLVVASPAGELRMLAGNVDILFPNSPEAAVRRAAPNYDQSPFADRGVVGWTPRAVDFLAAGDFDADGHADILTAEKGGAAFDFRAGDGHGGFAAAQSFELGGAITAFATGEVGRRDGLADIVVAIKTNVGAELLVFEHPEGALRRKPERFALAATATSIATGNFDDDFFGDIAVGGGRVLTMIGGRGQAYPWDEARDFAIVRPLPRIDAMKMPFEVASLSAGHFSSDRRDGLAVMSDSGEITLLGQPENKKKSRRPASRVRNVAFAPARDASAVGAAGRYAQPEPTPLKSDDASKSPERRAALRDALRSEKPARRAAAVKGFLDSITPAAAPRLSTWKTSRFASMGTTGGATLVRVKVSSGAFDDLAVIDSASARLSLIARAAGDASLAAATDLSTNAAPTAVVPMRLNDDALSDLVVFSASSAASVVMTAPASTFVVNSAGDETVCAGGTCTLRGAIREANLTAGADRIEFAIGNGAATIAPQQFRLADITGAVTIDGTTQPGYAGVPLVTIDGAGIASNADGLRVAGPNVVIRGLAINRFKSEFDPNTGQWNGGNGVSIFSLAGEIPARNNIVEACYFGLGPGGATDLGNDSTGILVFDSDDNLIGGTTIAARNVMSGSGSNFDPNLPLRTGAGLSITDGRRTRVKGNFIGTNAAGSGSVNNSMGIFVAAADSEFGGDEAGARNVISGNGDVVNQTTGSCDGPGVEEETVINVETGEIVTANNLYKGNFIGTDATGSFKVRNCGTGIYVKPQHQSIIGSITANGRNVISGNEETAIFCSPVPRGFFFAPALLGALPPGFCNIGGNNIGTDVGGQSAIPNSDSAAFGSFLLVYGTAGIFNTDTLSNFGAPGGTTPEACTGFCNLLAGNTDLLGAGRIGPFGVVGYFNNYVGTNRTGSAALPNFGGLAAFEGATVVGGLGVRDGGAEFSLGNLVSGNSGPAISVLDLATANIEANLVGTNNAGTSAVPNTSAFPDAAISVGGVDTQVGGIGPIRQNVVAGNAYDGIALIAGASSTTVINNLIGVNKLGAPLGNAGDGIVIAGDDSLIGGASDIQNWIANNGGSGILVGKRIAFGGSGFARRNTLRINRIENNGGLGIDLSPNFDSSDAPVGDGVTANDCGDFDNGPNDLQNYPFLAAPIVGGDGSVTVETTLKSSPGATFTIDYYASPSSDPSNYGEGRLYIGSATAETDFLNGLATLSFTSLVPVAPGSKITATATDAAGNTSEFSCAAGMCQAEFAEIKAAEQFGTQCGLTPVVVNVTTDAPDTSPDNGICDTDLIADGLQCSLRGAIQTVLGTGNPGVDLISFNIPGAGPKTITLGSNLPPITERTIVDARTQPGYTSSPLIEVRGDGGPAITDYCFGLVAGSDSSQIRGFALNRCQLGINAFSASNLFTENYVGLGPDGAPAGSATTMFFGIGITGNGNRVGDETSGNVVSNTNIGIQIENGTGNTVRGNLVGTDKTGTTAIPNASGVVIKNADENIVTRNLVGGNEALGIGVTGGDRNDVGQNSVGVGRVVGDLPAVLPNGRIGIYVEKQSAENIIHDNTVGNHTATEQSTGILVAPDAGAGNLYRENFLGVVPGTLADVGNTYGITDFADGQTIDGNTVGFNNQAGIYVATTNSPDNPVVENNQILSNNVGVTSAGEAIGNELFGILINASVKTTLVKLNSVGSNGFGVVLGDGATENIIEENIIGRINNIERPNSFGLWLRNATDTTVKRNVVDGNVFGVVIGARFIEGNPGLDNRALEMMNRMQGAPANYTTGNKLTGNLVVRGKSGLIIGENARNNIIGPTVPSEEPNIISGNTNAGNGYGILLGTLSLSPAPDALPRGNVLQGNFVGAVSDTGALPNDLGILIVKATGNTIGGPTAAFANYIVANSREGLLVQDSTDNIFLENRIGVTVGGAPSGNGGDGVKVTGSSTGNKFGDAGTAPRPAGSFGAGQTGGFVVSNNGRDGIRIESGASGNTISGALIDGNAGNGVTVDGAVTANNVIINSTIGTAPLARLGGSGGNGGSGVVVNDAPGTEIGRTGLGNSILGNSIDGIQLRQTVATNSSAQMFARGNNIGFNDGNGLVTVVAHDSVHVVQGNGFQDNGGNGIVMSGSNNNSVTQNVIERNAGQGVVLDGNGANRNNVRGNIIADNQSHGVLITNGANTNNIGGQSTGQGNTIRNNGGNGINLSETAGAANNFDPNIIFGNTGLGIDIGGDGPTPNDPLDADTGPNNRQNSPVIVGKQVVNDELILSFRVDSAPANSDYGPNGLYVEFFTADASGEGERFLGSAYYTLADYGGAFVGTKIVNLGNIAALGVTASTNVTATATDAAGNTSEFAALFAPTAAGVRVEGNVNGRNGGISGAIVTLAAADGSVRTTRTNGFGKYRFENVASGEIYVVAVQSRKIAFTPPTRVVEVTDSLFDVDFTETSNEP